MYLIEYSSKAIVNLNEEIDLSETDLFKRIERVALQKFYVQQKYPQAFEFLASTKQEESVEVKDIIKQRLNPIYNQAINKLYKDIDYSKFREGVDIEKAIEILNWTMFGVGEKGLKELFTFDDIGRFGEKYLEEWNVYAELLKYSFYK